MIRATVKQLFVHPIKGLTPQSVDRAWLEVNRGIRGDRAFALLFADTADDTNRAISWRSKKYFAVQNDWSGLAALECRYDWDRDRLCVSQDGREVLVADTDTGRDRIDRFFSDYIATLTPNPGARHPQKAPVRLVGTRSGDSRYPDRHHTHISIISQATFDDLSQVAGIEIDPRRFRPNLVVEGVEPWSEFEWVGRELQVGSVRLTVGEPIGRCLNIEVNSDTGKRDANLLSLLKRKFGHTQTGVLATVVSSGWIERGATLTSVAPADRAKSKS